MNNEVNQNEILSLPEICQSGDSTDFPSGVPELCVSISGDIAESYNVDITVTITEYKFVLTEDSNTVSEGLRTIALKVSEDSSGSNSESLRIACDNEGESQVEVYLLNEAGRIPRKPIIIQGEK